MFGTNNSSFGSPGSSSLFGQNKSSLFGQTSTPTSSSLFGPKPTGSVFGSPITNNNNNNNNSSSIFGSPQTNNNAGSSLFGQSKPLFGSTSSTSNTTTSAFGTGSSSIFGQSSNNNAIGGSMFGSTTTASSGTAVKFVPVEGSDTMNKNGLSQTVKTKCFCISVMKEYENKSFEELRVEDYLVNRKAPTTQSGSIFGSSNTGSSLFAGNNNNNNNNQQKSLFGNSTSTTFGGNNASSSLFNSNNNNQTSSSSIFNKPATGGLFNSTTTTQPQSSIFSSSTTPSTGFSFNNNTSTNAFGGGQNKPANSFFSGNQQSTGNNIFGSNNTQTTASPFNQQQQQTNSIFGNNNSTNNSFFNKPTTSTGFTFNTNNSFGSSQPSSNTGSSFFQNNAQKPSFFGPNQNTSGTGFFNSNTQTTQQQGSFFAPSTQQQPQVPPTVIVENLKTVNVPGPVLSLGPDENQTKFQMALIAADMAANPYGHSDIYNILDKPVTEKKVQEKSKKPSESELRFKVNKSSTSAGSTPVSPSNLLTNLIRSRNSSKKEEEEKSELENKTPTQKSKESDVADRSQLSLPEDLNKSSIKSLDINVIKSAVSTPVYASTNIKKLILTPDNNASFNESVRSETMASPRVNSTESNLSAAGVTISTPDYFCEPSILQMKSMIENGKVVLPNGILIGRVSYGTVYWPGYTELSNVALDEVVVFRHKEVTVYPEESKRPLVNQGLNRRAIVTLESVFHVDRTTKQEIRDPKVLESIGWTDRLVRVADRMGAKFIKYESSTGSWVFEVDHF